METSVLSFDRACFAYGKRTILKEFDLELRPGEVTILAAPNGSGKTTASWLAAGLLAPSSGSVRAFGRDPFHDRGVLGRMGFLAEGAPLPGAWTGKQILEFQRRTFPNWDAKGCERLLKTLDLDASRKVKAMSRGERGKLGLVAVLSTRPELLILDEPTLGLDVATRRKLSAEILGRVAEEGCPILLTSHEIAEAESGADRFVLLRGGQIVCDESIVDLLERHRILSWDRGTAAPPSALELVDLPTPMGERALARAWDSATGDRWEDGGGRVDRADLETIYLSLTEELDHA